MSNTTKPHPYAEILRAISDGKQIQFSSTTIGKWEDQDYELTLHEIAESYFEPVHYRIKPTTITINGHEVPEPLRELPSYGVPVFWPSICFVSGGDFTDGMDCDHSEGLDQLLRIGILHLTRDAAITHARALLSFTTTAP
jgi:hypothetical protein